MLATLVIGLREGLEAALIVGIIAAFLRRNGKGLGAMWLGIGAAVAISLGVGVTLELISASLPQAQQEGMETIIGAIAVVMVSGMIFWMAKNARSLKGELESQAASALKTGSTAALVAMAFLAVLREGVETAVFLLAAFQSSVDPLIAGAGSLIGVLISVIVGYGIYRGGVRLNMGRFFTITGAFLVLVAAGLVLKSLRTAHEAGWINIGQARTLDLSWLAPNGSPQAALLTGVLGIPADPRMIEVLGWALYLVPMLLFVLWPAKHRIKAAALPRFRRIVAVSLLGAGALLAVVTLLLPAPSVSNAPLSLAGSGSISLAGQELSVSRGGETSTFSLAGQGSAQDEHLGVDSRHYSLAQPAAGDRPSSLSLSELTALNGGRLPVGVSAQNNPGPFEASWTSKGSLEVWLADGVLIDADSSSISALTLSGGGLSTPRTLVLNNDAQTWQVNPANSATAASSVQAATQWQEERSLWGIWLPVVLGLAALVFGFRSFRREPAVHDSAVRAAAPTTAQISAQNINKSTTDSPAKGPVRV
ncbi:high-affinity iron transporter [Psychromicrobium silvestre]|uniref:High-affinity iron transporter n=1 Tax=Psychromicrobium silvestre TaxID=1645614 RepID=A0A7Y9LSS6_9MICC|nr:high-affinity iron transporter [Psychromicrobium silvestre]